MVRKRKEKGDIITPMHLLVDHYSMTPVAPVHLGMMALPPLVGSAHSHHSLASSQLDHLQSSCVS